MSGGNTGAVISDDVGAEAIADAEIEEEEEGTSPVLSHSHVFCAFVLDLDLDLDGDGFGDNCCLRVLVSAPRAWEGSADPGLFLGPQSEPEPLLGANSESAPT